MANKNSDPHGSTETTTQYEDGYHPAPSRGVTRSAWALAVAAFFLVLLAAWIVLQPQVATDPAPGGSSGNGVATGADPSTSRP